MKTARYYISVEVADTIVVAQMEISKAEYWRQMENFNKVVKETEGDEYSQAEINHNEVDSDRILTVMDDLLHAGSHVTLLRHECKEGYCFKPKRHARKQKSEVQ